MDSRKIKIIIVLVLLVVLVLDASTTYSKYVTSATGNMDATVAKWKMIIAPTDNPTTSNLTITPTIINDSTKRKNNTIAPGSLAYFDIYMNPTATEVSFKYTFTFTTTGTNVADFKAVKYKKVEGSGSLGTASASDFSSATAMPATLTDTKNYTQGTAFQMIKIRVYFQWIDNGADTATSPETLNNAQDTAIGNNNTTQYGKVQITLRVEQVV